MAIFLTADIHGRQCEQECRALSGGTTDKNASSVHADNVVHTGKTGGARIRVLRRWLRNGVKGSFENRAQFFGWNRLTLSSDLYGHFPLSTVRKLGSDDSRDIRKPGGH